MYINYKSKHFIRWDILIQKEKKTENNKCSFVIFIKTTEDKVLRKCEARTMLHQKVTCF